VDSQNKFNIELPNGAKFIAEGDATLVRELFQDWKEMSRALATPTSPKPDPDPPGDKENADGARHIPGTLFDRVYSQDRLGNVSLKALPRGEDKESEALLLILYGFSALRNETSVTADRLSKSARQSGIQNIRLHRVIARQTQYITESGTKKGKRYGLNNPGLKKGAELLENLLG
jgi:hypothetical protein